MIKTSTLNDVVSYIYNDNTKNKISIEQKIASNITVLDEMIMLNEAKDQLDACAYEPSPETLQNILEYAKLEPVS